MKKIYLIIGFCVVVAIQIFVPSQMILSQENVLKGGTAYKFKTRPIDPNDPFRGKYVTLDYEINSTYTKDSTWQRNDDVYVYLKQDSLGFAEIDTVAKQKLNNDKDFVIAKAKRFYAYHKYNDEQFRLNFDLPFNRFYMEESKARPAEIAVTVRRSDSIAKNVYGLVYVKDGTSVLENVFINDVAIKDYVEDYIEENN